MSKIILDFLSMFLTVNSVILFSVCLGWVLIKLGRFLDSLFGISGVFLAIAIAAATVIALVYTVEENC